MAKEKGAITYAFDDTVMRLGPVSQVREHYSVAGGIAHSLQIVVGLGASWASRLFRFGEAMVILAVRAQHTSAVTLPF